MKICKFRGHAYHMNRKTVVVRYTKLSFDASLHCDGVFIVYLLPKSVKKQVSLVFVKTSKSLSSCSTKKPKLGIIAPTRLLGEKFRSFSGTLRRRWDGLPDSSSDVKLSLSIAIFLCDNLLQLSSNRKRPDFCISYETSTALLCSFDFRAARKNF